MHPPLPNRHLCRTLGILATALERSRLQHFGLLASLADQAQQRLEAAQVCVWGGGGQRGAGGPYGGPKEGWVVGTTQAPQGREGQAGWQWAPP